MARIIAICNQKGGVGKTTTAINLAAYFAESGKRALVIDLDPQGNATSGLGIARDGVTHDSYAVLMGGVPPEQAICATHIERLSAIPSTVDLTGAEVELVSALAREHRLRQAIEPLRASFDFILIDSPPSLGLLTVNALVAADSTLIPVQCEYYALEGLTQLLKTIELVRAQLNPRLQIEGVLLTMADFRTKLAQEVIDEARNFFKEKVFTSVIPRSVRLSEAPSFGKPITLYDPHSAGAQKYFELSQELLARNSMQLIENKQVTTN